MKHSNRKIIDNIYYELIEYLFKYVSETKNIINDYMLKKLSFPINFEKYYVDNYYRKNSELEDDVKKRYLQIPLDEYTKENKINKSNYIDFVNSIIKFTITMNWLNPNNGSSFLTTNYWSIFEYIPTFYRDLKTELDKDFINDYDYDFSKFIISWFDNVYKYHSSNTRYHVNLKEPRGVRNIYSIEYLNGNFDKYDSDKNSRDLIDLRVPIIDMPWKFLKENRKINIDSSGKSILDTRVVTKINNIIDSVFTKQENLKYIEIFGLSIYGDSIIFTKVKDKMIENKEIKLIYWTYKKEKDISDKNINGIKKIFNELMNRVIIIDSELFFSEERINNLENKKREEFYRKNNLLKNN